jgi:glycosyltransferase involved in cell wall biosynthesis
MRVLLLTGMYPHTRSSRAGVAVWRQRRSLQDLGVNIDLLHCRPQGKWQWRVTRRALSRAVASGHYDLVHAHAGLRTTLLAVIQPLPLVITFHGTDVNGIPFFRGPAVHRQLLFNSAAFLNRQLARLADAVIVMTSEMKQRLPRAVQAKTSVEPMGVDTTLFRQHPRQQARAQLAWGQGPVVVFCTLGGKPVKRPELAEAAVREAQRACPDLTLFRLQGVEPERVPLVLSAADCLLVTSDREGSPNIVRESLACNLPIVSVPVGDVPSLLALHPTAGLVVPRDPVALGKALVATVNRPRPHLNGVMNTHSLEITGRRIISIYERVLQERGRSHTYANVDLANAGPS